MKRSDFFKDTLLRFSKLLHYLACACVCILFVHIFYHHVHTNTRCYAMFFAYGIILMFALRAYSAYDINLSSVRMLIYSQTLATLVADAFFYILLIIERAALVSPAPMLFVAALHLLMNCLWSFSTHALHFRKFDPYHIIVIYGSDHDLRSIAEMQRHEHTFRIAKTVKIPDDTEPLFPLEMLNEYSAVFIAGINEQLRRRIFCYCVENDICCYVSPQINDIMMMGAKHLELLSIPMFQLTRSTPSIEYKFIKRSLDILCSLAGILVFSPAMLGTALAVKLYDGGPAIYRQVRLTKDGRKFSILKFRSMSVNAEKDGVARLAAQNDSRITPVGRFIRACRLDELPQLFNILVGDMSIVGPRPERPEIAEQYEKELPEFRLRLQTRAGLTGLAQVYGKYNTDPYDKLRMDLMYINDMSLMQDIRLMFTTVKVLFMKESTSGIAAGQTTASADPDTQQRSA